MRNLEKHCVILIDYDNLLHSQKSAGILDVVTKALIQFPFEPSETRLGCDVRVYGGWYEEATMTRMAQDVTVELQRDFPVVLRLPVDQSPERRVVAANAELGRVDIHCMVFPSIVDLLNSFAARGRAVQQVQEEPGDAAA